MALAMRLTSQRPSLPSSRRDRHGSFLARLTSTAVALCTWLAVSTASGAADTHVVESGDTLSGIAHRHHVTVKALCSANRLKRDAVLQIGQELKIPSAKGSSSVATARTYTVKSGDTLSGIAHRHHTTVSALTAANRMKRDAVIRPGQELKIPGATPGRDAARRATVGKVKTRERDLGLQTMNVAATTIHYYEPTGPGRKGLRPIIMYLHGRGGNAQADCRRWAPVARNMGWLVCPQGPEDRGGGARGWNNSWASGKRIVMSAVDALRSRYGRRVQLYGNTLIGFSEGAFVAMNVGIREPRAFNRWLVLGAAADYWGALGLEQLHRRKDRVRRVYLITGQRDQVVEETKQVKRWLRKAGVAVRSSTPDIGHKVALETKPRLYRDALVWLDRGRTP